MMRRWPLALGVLPLLFVATVTLRPPSYDVGPQSGVDVQDYRFALALSDTSDEITGMAEVSVRFTDPVSTFALHLVSRGSDGRGMTVDRVEAGGRPVSFSHRGDALTITTTAMPGETQTFTLHYRGVPSDGLIISTNRHGDRTFFGDNWPNRARHWLPTNDHPSDKATVTFEVTAPAAYQVVSNGALAEKTDLAGGLRRTTYRSDVPLPTKVMVIGAARFAVEHIGEVRGRTVQTWVYPQDREAGFFDYALALPILAYFDSLIAPYPFEKLANVQSKTRYGGMENAGAIFYNETSVRGDRSAEGLIAHEIVHQWFGNSATEADWPHLWLSEGFATYLTEVYLESRYGPERLRENMARQRDAVLRFYRQSPAPLVDTVYADPNDLLNTNPYQRGAWVLHMLRHRLGDDQFFDGVRAYYAAFSGRNATTDDLWRTFQNTTGEDLQGFFDQWTRRAGQPRLEGSWRFDASRSELVLALRQTQEGAPFIFPLEIGIGDEVRTVEVTGASQTFTLPAPARPAQVVLDPRVRLLFENTGLRGE